MNTPSLLIVMMLALPWPAAAQEPPRASGPEMEGEVDALRERLDELAQRQVQTEALLKEVSRLLRLVEEDATAPELGESGGAKAPQDCRPAEPGSRNRWLALELKGCAALAEDGQSISFSFAIRNVTEDETLYVGAACCYAEWLVLVDDTGESWESTQWRLTRLPTSLDRDLIELAPGAELFITGSATPRRQRPALGRKPTTISLSGTLIRRTQAEQAEVDRTTSARERYPAGRPLTLGVAGIPLSVPR